MTHQKATWAEVKKLFASDRAVDRSTNDSEWRQTELRFTSDYDGAFNFHSRLLSDRNSK